MKGVYHIVFALRSINDALMAVHHPNSIVIYPLYQTSILASLFFVCVMLTLLTFLSYLAFSVLRFTMLLNTCLR